MDKAIIPECYVDTNLVETLVPPQTHYNHQKGCGRVTTVMKKNFVDRFALGIIDKDKHEVDYLKEFNELCKTDSLILHKHKTRPHYIIQISPAIERFILDNALKAGIRLDDYGLYADLDRLKKESKTVNSKSDPRFKELFKAIKSAKTPGFVKLASWITYLKTNSYNVVVDELRAL